MGIKVDSSVLEKFSDSKTVSGFNKEIEKFLDGNSEKVSREAVAYFYLTLCKMENEEEEEVYFAKLKYDEIRHMEGLLLTFIEAVTGEKEQRESQKSMIRSMLWRWADNLSEKKCSSMPTGIPAE
jgi:hypothetical protein